MFVKISEKSQEFRYSILTQWRQIGQHFVESIIQKKKNFESSTMCLLMALHLEMWFGMI